MLMQDKTELHLKAGLSEQESAVLQTPLYELVENQGAVQMAVNARDKLDEYLRNERNNNKKK